ncbi:MAG: hypothetical protein HRU26_11265 [Psychroserpens sp.]|nr:hypothetical protein [Psychroserpens sp.]
MKYFRITSVIMMLISLTSCSNHFKYFGNDFPETENAKIYFREIDIEHDFEVIGKLYCDFKTNTKDQKIQKKIMTQVKKHGGDGALFGNMSENTVGSITSSIGASKRLGKRNGTRIGGSISKQKDKLKDQMVITVIKFK